MDFNFAEFAQSVGIEPRPYQERMIREVLNAYLVEGSRSVLIESPTGSGKTCVGLGICKLLQTLEPNLTFGWIAMRRKLLKQARKENERMGVKNIQFVSMFDANPPHFDVLVNDEAQHAAAATSATQHHDIDARWLLGLSATPTRTDRVKLPYEKVVKDYGLRFLIDKGYLSPFRQFVIPEWTPKMVAERFLFEPAKWGKSIAYWRTEEECLKFHKLITDGGVSAACLFGNMSHTAQDEILDRYEAGEIQLLINMMLLTEGFDCEDLMSVWVRDSSRLPATQMAGRGLRLDPKNPNKIANIIQSEKTRYPFTRVTVSREQYVWRDDAWLSLARNELIEKLAKLTQQLFSAYTAPTLVAIGQTIKVSQKGKGKGKVTIGKVKKRRRFGNHADEPGGEGPFG